MKGPEGTFDKGMAQGVAVGICDQDQKLHHSGHIGGYGGPGSAQGRKAGLSEDQDIVAEKIYDDCGYARRHGEEGVSAFGEGGAVGLAQSKGDQAPEDQDQIALRFRQGPCHKGRTFGFVEEEHDEGLPVKIQKGDAGKAQQEADAQLEAEGMHDALIVMLAVVLGREDAGPGHASEDDQVEYEDQLAHDGDAGHGGGGDPAHHDIVQHVDEAGDALLDHDGKGYGQKSYIKFPGADQAGSLYFHSLFCLSTNMGNRPKCQAVGKAAFSL